MDELRRLLDRVVGDDNKDGRDVVLGLHLEEADRHGDEEDSPRNNRHDDMSLLFIIKEERKDDTSSDSDSKRNLPYKFGFLHVHEDTVYKKTDVLRHPNEPPEHVTRAEDVGDEAVEDDGTEYMSKEIGSILLGEGEHNDVESERNENGKSGREDDNFSWRQLIPEKVNRC